MASYIQRLPGLAEDGFYEEELERIRNRKQDVGLTYEPTPVDGETFPELPDDGQNWRYDEYNQPTLNPGVGDESYRNIKSIFFISLISVMWLALGIPSLKKDISQSIKIKY